LPGNIDSIVGFTVHQGLDARGAAALAEAARRALRHFPWLNRKSFAVGAATLEVWGHGDVGRRVHRTPDGRLLVLAGSPVAPNDWPLLCASPDPDSFRLPWDGRAVLLHLSADGATWSMWNDWCGSIPVFHAPAGQGRVAGTLEPVVAAAARLTADHISMPALVALLVHGHFLGDWTLYRDMKVVPPDCFAQWTPAGFQRRRLWTVRPSDARWYTGWMHLVDEMYEVSRKALVEALQVRPEWILPLSGGLDSRLIAAVGVSIGLRFQAVTYGHADWIETVHARQVARALRINWRRVPISPDYLARWTPLWLDWFGAALHCHGMYQMPFLEAVKDLHLPIVTGFTGDPLAGAQTAVMAPGSDTLNARLLRKWCLVPPDQVQSLLRRPIGDALDAMESELQARYDEIPGAHYQKLWLVFQWNHVFGFSYYQPMMYDYWKGVGTPYVNRDYANFTLSLPYVALDDRRLQKDVFRRHYLHMAAIGGTYGPIMFEPRRRRLLRGVALSLPPALRIGPLREFATTGSLCQPDALKAAGEKAVWPVPQLADRLSDWFDPDRIGELCRGAEAGDEAAYNKLRSIQAVAARIAPETPS